MSSIIEKLRKFAYNEGLNYVLNLDGIKPYINDIAFVLVGSVSTGLCTEKSDVDIALVCSNEIYDEIANNTKWNKGKPSEVRINGIQLHYYAITYKNIEDKLEALDENYMFTYFNAIVLQDHCNKYEKMINEYKEKYQSITDIKQKFDLLKRRVKALAFCINHEEDELSMSNILLEIIERTVKIIAQIDQVPCDPRKRTYTSGLNGHFGQSQKNKIKKLFNYFPLMVNREPESINVVNELQIIIEEINHRL